MSSPDHLPSEDVARRLEEIPGWALKDGAIERKFRFRNFSEAFGFMTRCALVAEQLNHHPDWSNTWNRVEVRLTTHEAGGLTALDFQLAEAMNAIAEGP